jgi:hypothetical protein
MLKQIKYALRTGTSLRVISFAVMFLGNLIFLALNASVFRFRSEPIVVAVVFASLALTSVVVCFAIADILTIREFYRGSSAYAFALSHVPAWKTLLARMIVMTLADTMSLAVSIFMLVLQATRASGILGMSVPTPPELVFHVIVTLIAYSAFINVFFLFESVRSGVFFKWKVRNLVSVISVFVTCQALNLLDAILIPFSNGVQRLGPLFGIRLSDGFSAGGIVYLLVSAVQSALMFIFASALIERRRNV